LAKASIDPEKAHSPFCAQVGIMEMVIRTNIVVGNNILNDGL